MKSSVVLIEVHRSIPFFLSLSLSLHPTPCYATIGFRLRESFTHGFQTRDTHGRPSLMPCRMQKRIMAYAPRCVSESRASSSSRSWRWKREHANWNLRPIHVTGADVYDFAKRESRRDFRWNLRSFLRQKTETLSIESRLPQEVMSMYHIVGDMGQFFVVDIQSKIFANYDRANCICIIYGIAKNLWIWRYVNFIEQIRSLIFSLWD